MYFKYRRAEELKTSTSPLKVILSSAKKESMPWSSLITLNNEIKWLAIITMDFKWIVLTAQCLEWWLPRQK